jgi:drug/metabolite transporter (DMT)-like permease
MLAIVAGSVVLSWGGGAGGGSQPAACVAGACLCWGLDNNLTKKVAGSDPLQIAMWKGLVAGATNLLIAFSTGGAAPPGAGIAGLLATGLVGYGLSLVCFIFGLRHIGSARTGAYFALAPFVGAVVGFATGEALTWQVAGAGALMAAGVWLHLTETHEHEHTHEALEHEHLHVHDEHHQHEHEAGLAAGEPHSHRHKHERLTHRHPHFPDLHHTHAH